MFESKVNNLVFLKLHDLHGAVKIIQLSKIIYVNEDDGTSLVCLESGLTRVRESTKEIWDLIGKVGDLIGKVGSYG